MTCRLWDRFGSHQLFFSGLLIGVVLIRGGGTARAQHVAVCGGRFDTSGDVTLRSAAPDETAGDQTSLDIGRDDRGESRLLMRFNLRGKIDSDSTIQSAMIELTRTTATQMEPLAVTVSEVTGGWNESTVTFNTQPELGSSAGVQTIHAAESLVRIDVTALVTRALTDAAGAVDLAVLPSSSPGLLSFRSSEASQHQPPRLVVRCAAPVIAPIVDESAADARQVAAMNRLRQEADEFHEIQLDRGAVSFADFSIRQPVASDGTAMARAFLANFRDLVRLARPETELQVARRAADDQHIVFRQIHQGIPVYGAELGVYLKGLSVGGLVGRYVPRITTPATPRLTATQAEAIALLFGGSRAHVVGDTQLRYLNRRLLGFPDGGTFLTWRVTLDGTLAGRRVLVDANSGAVRYASAAIEPDYDLDLEDADGDNPASLCDIFENNNIGSGARPPDSNNAAVTTSVVYNWWKGAFNRDSYDADGAQIEFDINVGFPDGPNASYTGCDIFMFSPGWPRALDVVAHEFTHAVIRASGGLEYVNESGALNESLADLFGYFVPPSSQFHGKDLPKGNSCNSAPGGTNRDLSNPHNCGQPEHYSELCGAPYPCTALCGAAGACDGSDKGQVHTNSGIHNLAGYLLANGGRPTINGVTYNFPFGIGLGRTAILYYRLLLYGRLPSSATLKQAASLAVKEAKIGATDGTGDFRMNPDNRLENDPCTVRNIYAAVGLIDGDLDCDGILDSVDPDRDNDGFSDATDNCPTVFNTQMDSDGDGIGDACDPDYDNDNAPNTADNCLYTSNPDQADADGDGVGDACDDSDFDGTVDPLDNCPLVYNYDQEDQDGDGIGDACDDDRDGDGVVNDADNCPDVANPQTDSDGDHIGDACDLCPGLKNADNGDPDGDGKGNPCDTDDDNDGVPDATDNCPLVKNPDQFDSDHNGVGFVCDADESNAFNDQIRQWGQQFPQNSPMTIPLPGPDCPSCDDGLPNRFESVIDIELPFDFEGRVFDSEGAALTKVSGHAGQIAEFKFEPAPYAAQAGAVFAASASRGHTAASVAALPHNLTRYFLAIAPKAGTDLRAPVPVSLRGGHQLHQLCTGNCDLIGNITVNELVRGVNIALGNAPTQDCTAFDANGDQKVTVEELVTAVNNALNGCG